MGRACLSRRSMLLLPLVLGLYGCVGQGKVAGKEPVRQLAAVE
jgi:hypothetical protein